MTKKQGVGYFETLFSAVEMSTMAKTLKQFALEHPVTETSGEGEVLNNFISTLIKMLELSEFEKIAPQLFCYPTSYKKCLEVRAIKPSEEVLNYLKNNIEVLLQEKVEVVK